MLPNAGTGQWQWVLPPLPTATLVHFRETGIPINTLVPILRRVSRWTPQCLAFLDLGTTDVIHAVRIPLLQPFAAAAAVLY